MVKKEKLRSPGSSKGEGERRAGQPAAVLSVCFLKRIRKGKGAG